MTTINNLSTLQSLSAGDQIPVYANDQGDTRKASLSLLSTFVLGQIQQGSPVAQYAAPVATGFNVQIAPPADGASVFLLLTPAAGYAAGTITLPAQALNADGQELIVMCTQAVTTLTVAGNGATVVGAPATLAANAFFRLRFDGVFRNWYRIG